MRYREINPGAAVSRFIKCYWVLESNSPTTFPQTIVPDGRAELLINLGEPFQQEIKGEWYSQPDIFFVGQITGPFSVRPNGPVRTIGVRFRPQGASRLLRLPMFELTDAAVPLADISKRLQCQVDRLREAGSLFQQLRALERILIAAANQRDEDRLVSVAVSRLERANGLIGIRELASCLGLSARQFERRFRNVVGIPPKLFSRMQRFQRVFQTMEGNAKWVDAAISCGYYDQAHLIRDFRQFSGTTPTALLSEEFDLSRRFL
jgi:AraC-like DNA-binding protein